MRYHFCLVLIFLAVLFMATGCDNKQFKSAKISISFPKAAGDTITVRRTNLINLEGIELVKVRLDSMGRGVMEIPLTEPVFTYINSKNLLTVLLIGPGDESRILPAKPGTKDSVRFEGDGAAINQAYNEAERWWTAFDKWKGIYSFQLEANEFLKAKDSLQVSYDHLLARLKSNPEVTAEKLDLLKRYANMHLTFYQYNFAAGKDSSEIPQSVREIVRKLPVDTIALNAGAYTYGLIAGYFYRLEISNAIYKENEEIDGDTLEAIFPLLVEKKIKAGHYPKPVEDFLRAKSASIRIAQVGLTPELRTLVKTLEKEIPSEEYKSVIREDVAGWEKIDPGKPAPDFAGLTPDGKKLALSDLRGKIVYVDIWATWCGYCIDEFPDSKKMQAEFKGNDQIAFLYVSVDQDTLAWKKMTAGNKVPGGLHMLNSAEASGSIWNLYQVSGIPRYLLVDAQGRIVTTHAERPSSGRVQTELRKLLAANRVAQQ